MKRALIFIIGAVAIIAIVVALYSVLGAETVADRQEDLKEEIQALNTCTQDSDCIAVNSPGCPFDCHWLVNKDSKYQEVYDRVATFLKEDRGMTCQYGCATAPTQFTCLRNKCEVATSTTGTKPPATSTPATQPPAPATVKRVWVEIEPRQCHSNPWERDWTAQGGGEDFSQANEPNIVKAFYAKIGVKIYDVAYQSRHEIVCTSCACPRGDAMLLRIGEPDVPKMISAGFRPV